MAALKGNMKPGQGFQPGNKWGELKKGVKHKKTLEWERMGKIMVGEANTAYLNAMEKMFDGQVLSEAEQEAMTRYEKMLEYFKPKLARQEITGKDGKDLLPQPLLGGNSNGISSNNSNKKASKANKKD